jgi:hypothetical protein
MREYLPLLLQLRLIADKQNDNRSLVAIVAEFERNGEAEIEKLVRSIKTRAHCRNVA